ncbi:glycosyltransferase [Paenibacillus sp. RC67]|uniref:glycosyltransferase n=1 Tax=Paenibacillus sp. RC67 TaxID=3039392 RepID=UPI0024AD5E07|nr:glycosyltransferase [Paenibacillus sp. RC67]
MIVKNEEKYLEKCLNSVKGVIDELIIVDTGSTDRTLEIAIHYKAKIFNFEWTHDFAAARNYSIQQASCDYILQLDADEYFDENIDLQKDLKDENDYYSMRIKNYNSDGGAHYHEAIRLFKRNRGLYYEGKLHEHLNILNNSGLIGGKTKSYINHTGYLKDIVQEKGKLERNLLIMEEELKDNPSPYNLYNMGKVFMTQNQYEKALDYFKKSYEKADNMSYVYQLFLYMLSCYRNLSRFEEGISLANILIRRQPRYIDFYYEQGRLFEQAGYIQDAEALYKKCISGDEWPERTAKEGVSGYLSYYRLACLYGKQGKIGEAFDYAFLSLTNNRTYLPALRLYFKLMLKANINNEEVASHLNQLYAGNGKEDIKGLLMAIYEVRHPLMALYFKEGGHTELDRDIRATVQMYNKDYEASLRNWLELPQIKSDNTIDVLTLSLILKDTQLLDKCRGTYNVNHKDLQLLVNIVQRIPAIESLESCWLETVLLQISEQLFILNEFETFEFVSSYILKCSLTAKLELARLLLEYGFIDTAAELMLDKYKEDPENPELNHLLGSIYMNVSNYDEAVHYLQQLVKSRDDYSAFESLYRCYLGLNDVSNAKRIALEMKKKFPLSPTVLAFQTF